MKRKGISPLIAAVLLIAFTMAVASLFAQWAPELMQGMTDGIDEDAEDVRQCSAISLEIIDGSNDTVTISQATGQDTLENASATWIYEDEEPAQAFLNETPSSSRWTAQLSNDGTSGVVTQIDAEPIGCEGAGSDTMTFE